MTLSVTNWIKSISTSIDEILNMVEPLSKDNIRWNPAVEEWSILQIVAHINEAIPYWLSEIKHVLNEPGSKWGRGLQDPARLSAVANPAGLDVTSELENLRNVKKQAVTQLKNITEKQLIVENPHRNFEKFGNKPVSFIIDHFIVEHLAKHLEQVQRNIRKL